MVKKIFSYLFVFMLVFTACICKVSAAEEEKEEYQDVVLAGRQVTYNYVGGPVKMPVTYVSDESEMRGAWVATVWNNDMEKQKGVSEAAIEEYKKAYLAILDTLEKYNMNTIFFQIRPTNDAFYESEYNDWSQFLVNAGVNPGWNPMEWMIEVTHERDMYFQCWMNAFRVTHTELFDKDAIYYSDQELIDKKAEAIANLSANNFAKKHPELVVMGDEDSKLILNPAELEVQQHILNTIEEIITKYDVDGCHFDDYFYLSARSADGINPQTSNLCFAGGTAYKENLTGVNTMNDLGTYRDYQSNPEKYDLPEGLALGEFRRQSLNNLMKNIRLLVDSVNEKYDKEVEFGSKPTAVWASNKSYCNDSSSTAEGGSNTHCGAYNSNFALFADTKYWVEQGYVDWIAPQVYYGFQSSESPYADIVKWWAGVVDKTNETRRANGQKEIKMYVAHGIYKYHDNGGNDYTDPKEMEYQLRYNQNFDCIKGSAIYAYTDLVVFKNNAHQQGVGNHFYLLWNNNPALPLPKKDVDFTNLKMGDITIKETSDVRYLEVSFNAVENASMYQIYRVPKDVDFELNNTKYRVAIIKGYDNEVIKTQIRYSDNFKYYIQAVSDNYYPSSEYIQLDFSNVLYNNAPKPVEITIDKNELFKNEVLNLTVPYAEDVEGDELTYTFSVSLNGIDGQFSYSLDNIQYNENNITAEFKNFGVNSTECIIKLVISDGLDETVVYSEKITLSKQASEKPEEKPEEKPNDSKPGGGMSCNFGTYAGFALIPAMLGIFVIKKKER